MIFSRETHFKVIIFFYRFRREIGERDREKRLAGDRLRGGDRRPGGGERRRGGEPRRPKLRRLGDESVRH